MRFLLILKPSNIAGPAWADSTWLGWWAVVSVALGVVFFGIGAVLGRIGFFQVLLFIQLAGPITPFNNAIRDLTSEPEAADSWFNERRD